MEAEVEALLASFAAKSCAKDNSLWLPFIIHSIDTAEIIKKLYHHWLPESSRQIIQQNLFFPDKSKDAEELSSDACYLAALLHDIGKLTNNFQGKISKNILYCAENIEKYGISFNKNPSDYRHDTGGNSILCYLKFPGQYGVIVGAHHGRPQSTAKSYFRSYKSSFFPKNEENIWCDVWKGWIDFSLEKAGFKSVFEIPIPNIKAQMIIIGLLIMSDWIASNTEYFPLIEYGKVLSQEEIIARIEVAWERLSLPPCYGFEFAVDFFERRFGFTANEFQTAVCKCVQATPKHGLYILEAPMGYGKTEAALAAAELICTKTGANGIFFGLPSQATANGIFGRIKSWAEKLSDEDIHSIRLAHGKYELNEEYQSIFHGRAEENVDASIIVHDWFEGRKQALLSDFVIATVDQFLLASLKQRHVMLRHLGLVGKVVIIDECHAYDAYMNVYLDSTLRFMGEYKVPVIILSATLPPKRRKQLIAAYLGKLPEEIGIAEEYKSAYPLITYTDNEAISCTPVPLKSEPREVIIEHIDEPSLPEKLKAVLSDGGCAGVIVNTVNYASYLANCLREKLPDYEIICFHSRFTDTDRALKEKEILKRIGKKSTEKDRNKLIIVGTQVLEQSLDIDFDFLVSEICPMDLLLQRAGRLHRHNRQRTDKTSKAVLGILIPEDEKFSRFTTGIYTEWAIYRTQKYLPERLTIPDSIPYLVGLAYADASCEEQESEAYKEYDNRIKIKMQNAKNYCLKTEYLDYEATSLSDIIDDDAGNTDNSAVGHKAAASVRDGEDTIEVLIMKQAGDNELTFVSKDLQGITVDIGITPSDSEAKLIAGQRIKLPSFFARENNFDKVIKKLNVMPYMWQTSGFLKGELLLVLDGQNKAELLNYSLFYSTASGLLTEKKEES